MMARRKRAARPRRKPYTAIGIRRVPCWRCGEPSHAQWAICADGNRQRGLCIECDIGMNAAVLRYLRDPDRAAKMVRYRAKLRAP